MTDFFLPVAQAAEGMAKVVLNVPIGQVSSVSNLAEYFQIWYSFVIGSIGILATVMVMWGGFKWLTSRGNSAVIGEAKERIISALIGLALVFLSYTILELINPRLVNLSMPGLETETYVGEDEKISPQNPTPQTRTGENTPSSIYAKLEGSQEFVTKTENVFNKLKIDGNLPEGFRITNSTKGGPTSQHYIGNAVDVSFNSEADARKFVDDVIKIDPSFSFIIERKGYLGSTWSGWGGVHLDRRSGTQRRDY